MKKLFSLFVFTLLFVPLFAQTEWEKFESQFPDSVVYVMPEFAPGRIYYRNGEFSNGVFNIAAIDQSLRFKDDEGKILSLVDNSDVARVTIGNKLFLHLSNGFAEVIDYCPEASLCVIRRLVFKKDAQKGAYGMKSETTSISSISHVSDDLGSTYNLSSTAEHRRTETLLLYAKKRTYTPSKKSFIKLFPGKIDFIESYLSVHEVDFDSVVDVLEFFSAVK
jgi:hypothetical protein